MIDIIELRKDIKQKRQALSPAERNQASCGIVATIQAHTDFIQARHIGSYWPNRGEVDLTSLQTRSGQTKYLPILQETVFPWAGPGLLFGDSNAPLMPNRFGIPEPNSNTFLRAANLDYLLVPLVAFDRQGNRIGMGGGYYDRALAGLHRSARRPLIIGVGYGFQAVKAIQPEPWDIPLDGVVTERELLLF